MEVSGQLHAPVALPPGKEAPGTRCIGGWVGPPKAGLDVIDERTFLLPLPGIVDIKSVEQRFNSVVVYMSPCTCMEYSGFA
jgi:hypothetical protein